MIMKDSLDKKFHKEVHNNERSHKTLISFKIA